MHERRREWWLLVGAALSGCSGRSESAAVDGGAPSPVPAVRAVDLARRHFGGAVGLGFDVRDRTFVPKRTFRPADGRPRGLVFGARATVRVEDGPRAPLVDISPLGLADVDGRVVDGALLYEAAAPATDVVVESLPLGFEELRVLHDTTAPRTLRWSLRLRPAAIARLVEGRVEIVEGGRVELRSEPLVAADVHGRRTALGVELEQTTTGATLVAHLDPTGLTYPIVVDPTWKWVLSSTGSAFGYQWIQPVPGTVVQLGGSDGASDQSAVFDVATETWTVHTLSVSRTYSASTWIPSIGKALVSGGQASPWKATAALVTPSPWTVTELTPTMTVGRGYHTSTLIDVAGAERVLLVGGGNATTSVDWFDPSTSTFVARSPMVVARTRHAATRLPSGRVLVTGGKPSTSTAYSSAEIYDPATNAWTNSASSLPVGRFDHCQLLLPDGTVFVVGGIDPSAAATETSAIYDPATDTFTSGPKMAYARTQAAAALLPGGKVLVTGGQARLAGTTGSIAATNTTEIYDPVAKTWSPGPPMLGARYGHGMAALSGGRVLVGVGGSATSTEILWPDETSCSGTSGSCPFCVDGVCCDTACTGQCEACDLAGKKGVCSPVSGEAPHGGRAVCSPFAVCVYDTTKASSACATSCASDGACAKDNYCVSPGSPTASCAPKKIAGAGCGAANECLSGFCVDGVCCGSACGGQCQACAEPGSLGVCTSVDGLPRGARPACTAPFACSAGACATTCTKDVECAFGRTCASGTCVPKASNGSTCTAAKDCLSGFCVDGVCCNTACASACTACDVAGKGGTCSAVDGTPHGARSCAPFAACKVGLCLVACTKGSDCLSGTCDSLTSTCTGAFDAGPSDGSVGDTGTDPDAAGDAAPDTGTVPDTGADLGVAESGAPNPGPKPSVGEFLKCTRNAECSTGHCVEGVCCDTACKDRCHSCALLTSPGVCTLEPVGVDLKNECGPAYSCLGTCDGTGQCIGAGKGTMCGRNRCTGPTTGVGPAYCAAPGASCGTDEAVAFDCAPYVCEPAFGACASVCKTTADCAQGFACDVPSRTCVAVVPAETDGGCSTTGGPGRGLAPVAALLAVVGIARRRRVR